MTGKEKFPSLPCNDKSKYGTITLEDEGVCISLRGNSLFSNADKRELIKYQDILNVQYDKRFFSRWPYLHIETEILSRKVDINVVDMKELKQFVDELDSHISKVKSEDKPPQTSADKLKEAKELLDIGALSQEEYDEIKKKYLKEF
jgi:hypothetical protein